MIEIQDLTKRYKDTTVYENFNLSLKEGQITCVLGESGSGKTTLLNCMAYLTPFTGRIPALKCAYIFQTPRLVPSLTVYGNLALVCRDKQRIDDMLERVRLSDKAQSYPVSLSGGQAQRAAIARAFLYGGDVILMDEPFSSLDVKLKREMTSLFFDMWRVAQPTVVFVTHDVDEAALIAHRAVVISGGKAVFDCQISPPPPRTEEEGRDIRLTLIRALTDR